MDGNAVSSDVIGTVWRIEHSTGTHVAAGQVVLILESMKMEIPVEAPTAGLISELHVQTGTAVEEGTLLFVMQS